MTHPRIYGIMSHARDCPYLCDILFAQASRVSRQMSLISFNTPPPPSHLLRDDEASNHDPLTGKSLKIVLVGEADASTASVADGSSLPVNHFPLVRLDVDVITDSIAGRLATSLLGHVLFLKNQIPL